MKRLVNVLVLLSTICTMQSLSALVVENSSQSDAPFHVRVFANEADFKNWLLGRGVEKMAVELLTQFSKKDLDALKTKGSTSFERNVNDMIDKISKGQAVLKAKLSKQLLDSHLGKRGVDKLFQLKYKHIDPKSKFEEGFPGNPSGIFLVITPHGSKIPLWSDLVLESDKYTVTVKKEKDITGKENKLNLVIKNTGYGIVK